MSKTPFSFEIKESVARKMTRKEYATARHHCRCLHRIMAPRWEEIQKEANKAWQHWVCYGIFPLTIPEVGDEQGR